MDNGDLVQPDAAYQSKYLLTDHLGTTRAELTVDAQGSPRITQNYDTMPYGELLDPPANPMESILFTRKQRDAESGLDFFGARVFSNFNKRFCSVDILFITKRRLLDPQLLNNYQYCRNNALNYIDLDLTEGDYEGRVVCCNRKHYICIYGIMPDTPVKKSIVKCMKQHEAAHIPNIDCPNEGLEVRFGRYYYPPTTRSNVDRAKDELNAYRVMLACLKSERKKYTRDSLEWGILTEKIEWLESKIRLTENDISIYGS